MENDDSITQAYLLFKKKDYAGCLAILNKQSVNPLCLC